MIKRAEEQAISEINVTPFIDIMLVLLIIFMVIAPLITSSVKIELPQTSSTRQDKQEKIIIYINKSEISVNEKIVNLSEIRGVLSEKSGGKKEELIYFYIDKFVPYERLAMIIEAVKEAGFLKIALATRIKER